MIMKNFGITYYGTRIIIKLFGKPFIYDCKLFNFSYDVKIRNLNMYRDTMVVDWSAKNGFGQTIIKKKIDKWMIDTEMMGDEFVKQVMVAVVDYIPNRDYEI